jgi:membrane peptidoglycan carboxypeptidase
MDKETLRMQMLAGVITEGEYAAAINQEIENTEKDSLNEHYVAGGIVGVGAINQIPSRAKADYEDAFEHFLGQKYEIKEEMEEEGMKKEDIEEEKTPLTPEQQKELEKAYDQLAAVMGIDPREVAMYVDLNQITKDKASGKLNNEGKEVEEPYNY